MQTPAIFHREDVARSISACREKLHISVGHKEIETAIVDQHGRPAQTVFPTCFPRDPGPVPLSAMVNNTQLSQGTRPPPPPLPIVSCARRTQRVAPIPSTYLGQQLRERVRALAENRPAVYRMTGRRRPRHLRRQGQVAPDPPAHLLPRRVSGRQGRADPVCRERHRLGVRTERVRRVPRASCARSAATARYFNYRGNVTRRSVLIKISGDPAPRVYGGVTVGAR